MGGDGYDTPLLVQIPGKGATNMYFTTHSLMDPDLGTDPIKKFITAYTAEYGNPPENAFAALGYDTMKLIADAISRAKSTDLKAIHDASSCHQGFPWNNRQAHLSPRQPCASKRCHYNPG